MEGNVCRTEVQQAQVYSQSGQPQAAQVLRQSLERELKQQVTQLEVSLAASLRSSFMHQTCKRYGLR